MHHAQCSGVGVREYVALDAGAIRIERHKARVEARALFRELLGSHPQLGNTSPTAPDPMTPTFMLPPTRLQRRRSSRRSRLLLGGFFGRWERGFRSQLQDHVESGLRVLCLDLRLQLCGRL